MEIKNEVYKKYKVLSLSSKILVALVLFVFVSVQTTQALFFTKNLIERKLFQARLNLSEKIRPNTIAVPSKVVKFGEQNLGELVQRVSEKYKMEPAIAWAMIDKESTHTHDRLRYEQTWKDQYSKKWQKPSGVTEAEYNMLFTSIGLMQVGYGLWKNFCELDSYSDLLIPEVNVDCGLKIVSTCLKEKENSIKSKGYRLKQCFKEYNGSGQAAENYANEMVVRVGNYLLEKEEPKMNSIMPELKSVNIQTSLENSEMKNYKLTKLEYSKKRNKS